jgi:CRISPR-associated protein Cas2
MPMTVIVTTDVAPRFRGFLASCMLELAPGVYTAPRMTKSVRERVWAVLTDWHAGLHGGSVVMTYRDPGAPGGQAVAALGVPPKTLSDADGLILAMRELREQEREEELFDNC